MKRIYRDYPIISILLLLIACIRFEYNGSSWAINFPGLLAGIGVLAVVAIILLFRIFNGVHEVCFQKHLIPHRLRFPYDVLIPIAIVAAMLGFTSQGPLVQGMGKDFVPQWVFSWGGDPKLALLFIGAVIGVVLLLRVFALVRAVINPPSASET